MKTQRGYTLIETLVAMLILVMLSASGLYGWQYWQQSQRLWQPPARRGTICSIYVKMPTGITATTVSVLSGRGRYGAL
ncbi:prepilin-type N-terminal cleavage/methylation domain-containing protein [Escherichia coli]|nr:prepilin-type N-terminal cleavage/methylation domain-containing protein [Escherichia coli]HDX4038952.1 prepilin-type N-terminal cleavage/methylation domain-containing protein [Escherichia coli]